MASPKGPAKMPISPAPTDSPQREGFTFPEILVAMMIVCLTVYASASALITILRLEDTGLRALHASMLIQTTACRHFLPAALRPKEPPPTSSGFPYPPASSTRDSWVIYTLTPADDSDSMAVTLALSKG